LGKTEYSQRINWFKQCIKAIESSPEFIELFDTLFSNTSVFGGAFSGTYRVRMEAKDGSFGFDLEATYDRIEPGKSFSYTMADGRLVHLVLHDDGNATEVTITFEAENQNLVELQRDGWQAILNNYKKYTESV
jgi:hypothetical protein